MTSDQEIPARDKVSADRGGEPTYEGVVFTPAVDIYEDPNQLVILADLPGVPQDRIDIDLEEGRLSISGRTEPAPEGETSIRDEYQTGRYFRQFVLSEVVDQKRITAVVKDGVLTLTLPKVAPARPRKIEVRTG